MTNGVQAMTPEELAAKQYGCSIEEIPELFGINYLHRTGESTATIRRVSFRKGMGCEYIQKAEENIPEFIRWLTVEDLDIEVNA